MFDSLWQFITKCDKSLLQNAPGFYYEMWQLLQNATVLLQNATVLTNCDVYYKLRQYNDRFKQKDFFPSEI